MNGYRVGQFICKADFAEEALQVAYSGYVDDNIRRRKAFNGAVRIAFSAPARSGQNAATAHEVRDGQGNVVRVERGASAGLRDAAQLLSGGRRRGGDRSDVLASQAKALKEARRPKQPEIDGDDLERRELEAIKGGHLQPYYLTPPQENRLATLQAVARARCTLPTAGVPRAEPHATIRRARSDMRPARVLRRACWATWWRSGAPPCETRRNAR